MQTAQDTTGADETCGGIAVCICHEHTRFKQQLVKMESQVSWPSTTESWVGCDRDCLRFSSWAFFVVCTHPTITPTMMQTEA
jgi:hypothetical protein